MFSILIGSCAVGQTPRHFGVNVEVQDHHERCNLWDWLADSGSTVVREFHPEKYLRKEPMNPEQVAGLRGKADFDQWRGNLVAHPESLPWHLYRFNEAVEWLGVPDGIIAKVKQARAEPIVSMGYYPKMFSESLLATWVWDRMPTDEEINWRAAACAYEYYFAFLWHYARDFGVKYFNLHNEPEFFYFHFYFPPELMPDPPRHYQQYGPRFGSAGGYMTYMAPMVVQMAVLARIARLACEDVRAGLKDPRLARDLTLSGPAWASGWEYFWKLAHPFVEICDYHHYAPDYRLFEQVHRRVAVRVRQTPGKKTACTEFGRKGGPLRVSDLLFDMGPALEAAGLMMSALSFTKPDDPPCEFVTFYHFQFPATHRNYKNLVYGDMNVVDWSGRDKPLMDRGDQRYPSFEELQLRHPTAAYHMFRMLARCVPGDKGAATSFPVLDLGTSSSRGIYAGLRFLAVDTGRDLIVTIQNPSLEKAPGVEVDLELFSGRFRFAVIRETSSLKQDEVVAQMKVENDRLQWDLPPQSLTQVILTPLALDEIASLHLVEHTLTPGGMVEGLALHQTTRLQALGVIDGEEYDLSQMNLVWTSSDPEGMPVYQGGLVVCVNRRPATATIRAGTLDQSVSIDLNLITHGDRSP